MATGTGLDRQVGYVVEDSYGVGKTVTKFLPAVSESLTMTIASVESQGQIAGAQMRRWSQWSQGFKDVAGDVGHELLSEDIGVLLYTTFGTVTTAGTAAPYTHEYWPASSARSMTVQVGRPAVYGSVIPFTYTGCKVQSFALGFEAGEIVTWNSTLVGQDEQRGTALAAASYSQTARPWNASQGAFTLDGTVLPVRSLNVTGEMSLSTDRRYVGSTLMGEPLRVDLVNITGDMTVEWGNVGTAASTYGTAVYDKYVNGVGGTIVQSFASGTTSATITAYVRFDPQTMNSSDNGIVMHQTPWTAITPGTLDSQAFKITLKNSNASGTL